MDDLAIYQQMHQTGATPVQILAAARATGMDEITQLRMLRITCGLSLPQAKEILAAGDAFARPQEVAPGKTVFWEGWTSTEGFYLMQAVVTSLQDDTATLSGHRKFLLVKGKLEEAELSEPVTTRMRADRLRRPLAERFSDTLQFLDGLAKPLREAV